MVPDLSDCERERFGGIHRSNTTGRFDGAAAHRPERKIGVPQKVQRLFGERTNTGINEISPLGGNE